MSYPNKDTQSTHRCCGVASSFPRVHFVAPLPLPPRTAGPWRAPLPRQPSAQTRAGPLRPSASSQPDCRRETPVIVQPVQDYFYQTRTQRRRTRNGDYITISQTTFIRNAPPALAQARVSHQQSAAPIRTAPQPTSTSQAKRAIDTSQAPPRPQTAAPSQTASRNGRAPPPLAPRPPPRPRTIAPSHVPMRTSRPPVLRGGQRTVTFADPTSESAGSKHYYVPADQLRQPRMPPQGFVIGEVTESAVSRAPSTVAPESPVSSWAVNVANATWRERGSHVLRQSGSRH
ncbi:hypothetical protein MY11210_008094 [Beauveria gryllotalpidicola]